MALPFPSHTITLRVRYPEVDAMGYVHHSRYLEYFELGRVELLRHLGHSYADLEKSGVFFVVTRFEIRYKQPARYDEELTLSTRSDQADARSHRPRLRASPRPNPSGRGQQHHRLHRPRRARRGDTGFFGGSPAVPRCRSIGRLSDFRNGFQIRNL